MGFLSVKFESPVGQNTLSNLGNVLQHSKYYLGKLVTINLIQLLSYEEIQWTALKTNTLGPQFSRLFARDPNTGPTDREATQATAAT